MNKLGDGGVWTSIVIQGQWPRLPHLQYVVADAIVFGFAMGIHVLPISEFVRKTILLICGYI